MVKFISFTRKMYLACAIICKINTLVSGMIIICLNKLVFESQCKEGMKRQWLRAMSALCHSLHFLLNGKNYWQKTLKLIESCQSVFCECFTQLSFSSSYNKRWISRNYMYMHFVWHLDSPRRTWTDPGSVLVQFENWTEMFLISSSIWACERMLKWWSLHTPL